MIYVGLELGSFFEIPFESPCHQILRGVNPLLQMIFTFMQMYFIFMNARVSIHSLLLTNIAIRSTSFIIYTPFLSINLQLNIHRFKVLARFGLMHICATNICVWIRTLVLESLKELTLYYQSRQSTLDDGLLSDSLRTHSLKHAGTVLGTHSGPQPEWEPIDLHIRNNNAEGENVVSKIVNSSVRGASKAFRSASYLAESTTAATTLSPTPANSLETTTLMQKLKKSIVASTEAAINTFSTAASKSFDIKNRHIFDIKTYCLSIFH